MNQDIFLNFLSDPGRESRLQVFDSVVAARPQAVSRDLETLLRLVSWHAQWETVENAVKNVLFAVTPKNTGKNSEN
jgi:hypothetical protein